jgi:hypothetical protein
VIFVLCALMLLVGLIAACFYAWPRFRRAVRDAVTTPADARPPAAAAVPDRTPQTLEGTLTRQLLAAEITRPQYRHAMATLAARDAERHPLRVPPDVSPPEAA